MTAMDKARRARETAGAADFQDDLVLAHEPCLARGTDRLPLVLQAGFQSSPELL